MNRFARLIAWVLLFSVSACETFEITFARTPTPGLDGTATIAPPQFQNAQWANQVATPSRLTVTPLPPAQPTPQNVLASGTVLDGPFLFDLRLFRDPSFNPHPVAASLYGDLDGVGAWMYWFYNGPAPIGPIETYWGTVPHVERLLQGTYPTIRTGSSGGRTGGVMLPGGFLIEGESKTGDRIQVALKVVTPDGEYGAVLAFTLQKSRNGFEPADVSVDVLQTLLAPTPSARLMGAKVTYTDPVIG